MGKEFPVPGAISFPSPQTQKHDRGLSDAAKTSRIFGWVHYRAIGPLTAALDYALILVTSAVAGFGYHSIILQVDVPNLMPYLAAGNIVAALFVFGAASRGMYSPSPLPWSDAYRRNLICERLQILPIRSSPLIPDQHVDSVLSRSRRLTREFTVELQRPPLSWGELAIKRAFDLVLASGLIVALVPLSFVISVFIKLDSLGPVIFSQRRRGFNASEFKIFKFRTMKVLEDRHAIAQARKNDPRVTRVGRILRRTSIDELPQQCDLWYIKNWSFWLDLRILVRTCFEFLRGGNAH